MICPSCNAKNLAHALRCVSCGAELDLDATVPDDPLIGRVLGEKYELLAIIGEGSMGCVYSARQVVLDKEVAVKVLHQHVAKDPKVAKRFHREARTASKLSHPNSLEVFDYGREEDGTLFIAMELLDGPDLLEVINMDSPLSPARIGTLLGQVLLALEEAHGAGIVHRDLKPENVMVIEDRHGNERVKVCDFGIAKMVEAEGSAITVTGFVCGTPEYIAPEQARGESLDSRADLYALGCMLYQMLTASVPFRAGSALGTITQHLTDPVEPPRKRRPELYIPLALEAVCLKAMRKDREQRYQSAAEMRDALERAIAALGPLANDPLGTHREDPTSRSRDGASQSRWLVPAALGSGLLLVGVAAWLTVLGQPAPLYVSAESPPESVHESDAEPAPAVDAGQVAEHVVAVGSREEPREEPEVVSTDDPATQSTASQVAKRRRPRPRIDETAEEPAAVPEPEVVSVEEPAPENPGVVAYDEGRRRFLENDVRGAIERFEAAATLMPRNAQVQKELGRAYMRQGDAAAAVAAYRRYLELRPNAPDRLLVEQILSQHQ